MHMFTFSIDKHYTIIYIVLIQLSLHYEFAVINHMYFSLNGFSCDVYDKRPTEREIRAFIDRNRSPVAITTHRNVHSLTSLTVIVWSIEIH